MWLLILLCVAAIALLIALELAHRYAHVRCELCARTYAMFRRWAPKAGVRSLRHLCWRCALVQRRLEEVR